MDKKSKVFIVLVAIAAICVGIFAYESLQLPFKSARFEQEFPQYTHIVPGLPSPIRTIIGLDKKTFILMLYYKEVTTVWKNENQYGYQYYFVLGGHTQVYEYRLSQ